MCGVMRCERPDIPDVTITLVDDGGEVHELTTCLVHRRMFGAINPAITEVKNFRIGGMTVDPLVVPSVPMQPTITGSNPPEDGEPAGIMFAAFQGTHLEFITTVEYWFDDELVDSYTGDEITIIDAGLAGLMLITENPWGSMGVDEGPIVVKFINPLDTVEYETGWVAAP